MRAQTFTPPHRVCGLLQDGRAGMAAVVMAPTTDLVALGKHAANVLPSYAVPIFLRALPQYVNRPGPCGRPSTQRTD